MVDKLEKKSQSRYGIDGWLRHSTTIGIKGGFLLWQPRCLLVKLDTWFKGDWIIVFMTLEKNNASVLHLNKVGK